MNFNLATPHAARKSGMLALLVTGLLFLAAAAQTNAQTAPSVPVSHPPTADAAVYEVEGKITAYDRINRTMTANGITFSIPSTLLIKTEDLDATVGNITFDALTDPLAEASRSIIGGSVTSLGNTTTTTTATETRISFVATSVYVEFAENVLAGTLSDINLSDNSFRVNGVTIRMNADPRFPHKLLDAGGNPIALSNLSGFEGTLVSVEGYFDATQNVLYGVTVETEVITQQPGKDGVAITGAEGRTDNSELRVNGINTRNSQGAFATSVSVHAGGLNTTATGCAGPRLGGANVNQTDGSWSFRQRPAPTIPTKVCAVSPLGGVAERAVDIRN
ncbi:MAG TPA: hypothetical protein VD835_15025 [Pyrinomonadaceae bacterium]|nr:hypothetical protein [Pyrinomonadaceae bacterium]